MDSISRTVADSEPAPHGEEIRGGEIIKWLDGLEVAGRFLGLKEINTQLGPSTLLRVSSLDGTKKSTFGCPAVLRQLVEQLDIGEAITIRCIGKVKTSQGFEAWNFRVWRNTDIAF